MLKAADRKHAVTIFSILSHLIVFGQTPQICHLHTEQVMRGRLPNIHHCTQAELQRRWCSTSSYLETWVQEKILTTSTVPLNPWLKMCGLCVTHFIRPRLLL
jgi:hypothetical protein